jgi:hypothetical protein
LRVANPAPDGKEVRDLTLPGFTAQASFLRETSGRYRMLFTAEVTSSAAVVPAAPRCEGCESSYYCMQCSETGAWEDCRWGHNCLRWCVPRGIWGDPSLILGNLKHQGREVRS